MVLVMAEDCIFCKIVKGEVPAAKIYENDKTFAFLDIGPVHKGHTLVIPKEHYENIFDIPIELFAETMRVAQKMAKAVKEGVHADGINIGMNNLKPAGQLVMHAHIHVIPRVKGDGLRHWPGTTYAEGEDKDVAEKIKAKLS